MEEFHGNLPQREEGSKRAGEYPRITSFRLKNSTSLWVSEQKGQETWISFWKSAFQGSFQESVTNTLSNRQASTSHLSQEVQCISRPGNFECFSKCEVAAGDIYHKPLQLFCGNNWRVTVSPGLCLTPSRSVKFQLHFNDTARITAAFEPKLHNCYEWNTEIWSSVIPKKISKKNFYQSIILSRDTAIKTLKLLHYAHHIFQCPRFQKTTKWKNIHHCSRDSCIIEYFNFCYQNYTA